MMTLEQFKAGGGYVAFVPNDSSHIQTVDKTMRSTSPTGATITRIGPEMLQTEIIEGRRVVRFADVADFQRLLRGNDGAAWERLNPHLCQQIAELSRSNKPAGAIWA